MTATHESERTPAERVEDLPRILEAMDRAVREALLSHKRAGDPVAVWRNERVEWIQPEDIPVDDPLDHAAHSKARPAG